MPCSNHAVLLKAPAQHARRDKAVLCCGLEKNGMVREWHGRGVASVNQTRPRCVNRRGKTHSKPLAARHAMYESAFSVQFTSVHRRTEFCARSGEVPVTERAIRPRVIFRNAKLNTSLQSFVMLWSADRSSGLAATSVLYFAIFLSH